MMRTIFMDVIAAYEDKTVAGLRLSYLTTCKCHIPFRTHSPNPVQGLFNGLIGWGLRRWVALINFKHICMPHVRFLCTDATDQFKKSFWMQVCAFINACSKMMH
jgi:hypothetical protein